MKKSVIDELDKKMVHEEEVELIEIIESNGATPRGVGAFMFVDKNKKIHGTIGGGISEYDAYTFAFQLLQKKKNGIKTYNMRTGKNKNNSMICGGNNKVRFTYLNGDKKSVEVVKKLKEQNKEKSIVYIFGAGNVAVELAKMLDFVGFNYIVWDDRKEYVNHKRFKNALKLIVKSYEDINNVVNITDKDYVIIVTSGHEWDYVVEKEILRKKPYYIGCIGSKEKQKIVNNKLKVSGFCDKELSIVHSPIGLQIGADTPEEIAISIVSELILYKAKLENRKKYLEGKTLLSVAKNKK